MDDLLATARADDAPRLSITLPMTTLPVEGSALDFFVKGEQVDAIIAAVRTAARDAAKDLTDMNVRKVREALASVAYKVSTSKTAIEKVGEKVSAEQKELPRKIDAARKRLRDELDKLRDEVRAPLDAWEAAEAAREKRHVDALDRLNRLAADLVNLSVPDLAARLDAAEGFLVDAGASDEQRDKEVATRDDVVARIEAAIVARRKYDADQAELARLREAEIERQRKDREAEIARQAAENARREEAERAQRDADARIAAANAERDAAEAATREANARAERIKREAEEAAALAQRQREDAERAAAQRAADAHRVGAIRAEAVAALDENGVPTETAKFVVALIARGDIPRVSIAY